VDVGIRQYLQLLDVLNHFPGFVGIFIQHLLKTRTGSKCPFDHPGRRLCRSAERASAHGHMLTQDDNRRGMSMTPGLIFRDARASLNTPMTPRLKPAAMPHMTPRPISAAMPVSSHGQCTPLFLNTKSQVAFGPGSTTRGNAKFASISPRLVPAATPGPIHGNYAPHSLFENHGTQRPTLCDFLSTLPVSEGHCDAFCGPRKLDSSHGDLQYALSYAAFQKTLPGENQAGLHDKTIWSDDRVEVVHQQLERQSVASPFFASSLQQIAMVACNLPYGLAATSKAGRSNEAQHQMPTQSQNGLSPSAMLPDVRLGLRIHKRSFDHS